ncbi:hypothetical protein N9T52_00270 [bacterium]|nr:hypothetical protein [bacterium]
MVDESESTISADDEATQLLRVTLAYSSEQDRIFMDGISAHGETKRLWLTARLVNRLVPHLLRITGNASSETRLSGVPITQNAEATKPVEFVEGSEESLIGSIDIRSRDSATALIFKDRSTTAQASLILSLGETLQWANALKQCHIRGGWSASLWEEARSLMPNEAQHNSVTIH